MTFQFQISAFLSKFKSLRICVNLHKDDKDSKTSFRIIGVAWKSKALDLLRMNTCKIMDIEKEWIILLPLFRTHFLLDVIVNTFHDFIGILTKAPLFSCIIFVTVTSMSSAIIRAANFTDITIGINQAGFWTSFGNTESGSGFQQIWFPSTMTTEFRATWKMHKKGIGTHLRSSSSWS